MPARANGPGKRPTAPRTPCQGITSCAGKHRTRSVPPLSGLGTLPALEPRADLFDAYGVPEFLVTHKGDARPCSGKGHKDAFGRGMRRSILGRNGRSKLAVAHSVRPAAGLR